jgi:hypothetical protein
VPFVFPGGFVIYRAADSNRERLFGLKHNALLQRQGGPLRFGYCAETGSSTYL